MRSNGSYQMSNLKSVDRSQVRDEYIATQSAGGLHRQSNCEVSCREGGSYVYRQGDGTAGGGNVDAIA